MQDILVRKLCVPIGYRSFMSKINIATANIRYEYIHDVKKYSMIKF